MGTGDQRASSRDAGVVRPWSLAVDVSADQVPAAHGLGRWLVRVAPSRARGTVSLAIVSDARVRTLNRLYRGLDYPTDVLSFSCEKGSHPRSFLGDIVIARGVARRQARSAGRSEREELRILALHGLLHLLGYDHERDGGAMARLERRLRTKGGLGETLIEREARRQAGA